MKNTKDYKDLLSKVDKVVTQKDLDLSSDEDLSIAIMNLISIEEHLFFTSQKTGKSKYLDLLNEVRLMRTDLLKRIITDYEGEVWCISKHLLASSMRVMEVGTKALKKGDKKQAMELFNKAFKLYSLFWGINLNLVGVDKVKSKSKDEVDFIDEKSQKTGSTSIFDKLGAVVQKAIDCCKE